MGKIKILYIVTQAHWGGAQKYIWQLACRLNPTKFEIAVAAGGKGPLFEKLKQQSITTIQLKHLTRPVIPIKEIQAFWELYKLISRGGYDIVHLNSSKAGLLGSLAGRLAGAKRIVYTIHGSNFNFPYPSYIRLGLRIIERFASLFRDKIITVSHRDERLWLHHRLVPAAKLVTIHNGLLFSKAYHDSSHLDIKPTIIKNCGLPPDALNEPLILSLSNFYRPKALDVLIKAAHKIITTGGSKLYFILLGSGPKRKQLEALADQLGLKSHIFFCGHRENVFDYLSAADLMILPSLKEGCPYALLEAMVAGTPIIASKVGGVPEIVQHKKSAWLVPAGNPNALAIAIQFLLSDQQLCQRLQSSAQRRVKKYFNLNKMIARHQRLYNQLLGKDNASTKAL